MLQVAQDLGEDMFEADQQMAGIRDKQARIPIKLAALHKHLGKLTLRLLGKRLHLIHIGLAAHVTHLYVAIARFRTRGLHTHSQQHVVLRHIVEACFYAAYIRLLVDHQLIRRRNDDVGRLTRASDTHSRPGHAGCRIAVHGFNHHVTLGQLWQLLAHDGCILLRRTYKDIFAGHHL